MKLKTALKNLPLPELLSICEFWNLKPPAGDGQTETERRRTLADFLYPRMQTAQYFRAALERLEDDQRDVVYFLAVHGCDVGRDEILTRCFAANEGKCAGALSQLALRGLAFTGALPGSGEPVVGLPESFLRFIDLPANWKGFLGFLLRQMNAQQLSELVATLPGMGTKSERKAAEVFHVRRHLLEPRNLQNHIKSLPDEELQFFNTLLERKGFALYRDLLEPGTPRRFDHTKTEHLNSLIQNRGLVFAVAEGSNKYTNLLIIPRDIYQIVTTGFMPDDRGLHELDGTGMARSDVTPPVITDNSRTLLRDLAIIASSISSLPLKRLTTGGINKNDLKRVLPVLGGGKPLRYAMFLAAFLVGRKFLIPVGNVWRVVEGFLGWLGNPRQCYWDMYTWWLDSHDWQEEATEGSWLFADQKVDSPLDVLHLRKAVLQGIASIPGDKWLSFNSLHDSLRQQMESKFPTLAEGRSARPFRSILSNILEESLNWLGVLSQGTYGAPAQGKSDETARRTARRKAAGSAAEDIWFQPTAWGTALFDSHYLDPGIVGEADVPAIPLRYDASWLIVQPNLEIMAPPDLAPDHVYNLAGFCAVRNIDVMSTFEITRESVRAAMDRGVQAEEVLRFLRELSRVDVPETVTHLIQDCSNKHGEVYLSSAGGYITTDDPVLIQQIRANAKLQPLVKETLGDKALILAPDVDLKKVVQAMRHVGLMPHTETGAVHRSADERFHLSLSAQEFCDLIAAVRFLRFMEEHLEADISEGKAAALVQKLKPETAAFAGVRHYAESTERAFEKRFRHAVKKLVDDISDKYKGQLSRLVTRSMSGRGPSKYNYRGANPAVERDDIVSLISFARDYELDVEMQYIRQNEQEAKVTLTPKSIEGTRLYAHCHDTDSDAIYAIERILRAKLI